MEESDERRISMSTLILIRGLPGSGKTRIAKNVYDYAVRVAADDYFDKYLNGEFVPSHIGKAHAWCLGVATGAMENGARIPLERVVVHNTFTQLWEMSAYIEVAKELGWDLKVISIDSGLSDEKLALRNVHNVPVNTIKKMRNRWEPFPGEVILSQKEE